MKTWVLDFVGPLPMSDGGNRHILVIADYYTRWAEVIPLLAETVARVIMRDRVSRYGVPVVHTVTKDRILRVGCMIKELSALLGMKKVKTTASTLSVMV